MGRCALEKFEIAGLTVEFETGDGLLFERSRPYLTSDDKKTDIKIELDDDFFMRRRQSYPMLTLDECRYVWTGEAFYLKLLEFNGFMLHSSCVCRGGNAYLFSARSRPYLTSDDKKTDIKIELDDDFFMRRRQSYPMLTLDECRYVWTGEAFYLKLLEFNGFMLHSSCVCRGGNAYLFSARSGTGKSTHTHLWLSEFPDAYILNDDKPAIIINESGAVAYGTPFSGKNDESRNAAAPIRAVVFIERSQKNSIEKISPASAVPLFMSQTVRPKTPQYMGVLLSLLDALLKEVPVFLLKCNMDPSAAHVSYDGIEEYYRQNPRA